PQIFATVIDEDIDSNTTWGPAGSPYVITADVKVESGVKLTITTNAPFPPIENDDVEVIINNDVTFSIEGELETIDDGSHYVSIQGHACLGIGDTYRGQFKCKNGSTVDICSDTEFYRLHNGIHIYASDFYAEEITVETCDGACIYLEDCGSSVKIRGDIIDGNSTSDYGVKIVGTSLPDIGVNDLEIRETNVAGVYVNTSNVSFWGELDHLKVKYNNGDGVYVAGSSEVDFIRSEFSYNTDDGIDINGNGASVNLGHCELNNNSDDGAFVHGSESFLGAIYCEFENNGSDGIQFSGNGDGNISFALLPTYPPHPGPCTFSSNSDYDIRNLTSNWIEARHNNFTGCDIRDYDTSYPGDNPYTLSRDRIYDKEDNPNYGTVNFFGTRQSSSCDKIIVDNDQYDLPILIDGNISVRERLEVNGSFTHNQVFWLKDGKLAAGDSSNACIVDIRDNGPSTVFTNYNVVETSQIPHGLLRIHKTSTTHKLDDVIIDCGGRNTLGVIVCDDIEFEKIRVWDFHNTGILVLDSCDWFKISGSAYSDNEIIGANGAVYGIKFYDGDFNYNTWINWIDIENVDVGIYMDNHDWDPGDENDHKTWTCLCFDDVDETCIDYRNDCKDWDDDNYYALRIYDPSPDSSALFLCYNATFGSEAYPILIVDDVIDEDDVLDSEDNYIIYGPVDIEDFSKNGLIAAAVLDSFTSVFSQPGNVLSVDTPKTDRVDDTDVEHTSWGEIKALFE
ncbi:right-handed parallel beta-helix repeat-containing protein, partial [bacterium]|nr:right-handed parallel beta-helix repeat-containing protein [bacterium]